MKIHITREPASLELVAEMDLLMRQHFDEFAHFRDRGLQPNFHAYLEAEKLDSLAVFTIRDKARNLRGYAIYFIQNNAHSIGSKQAVQDSFFMEKALRSGIAAAPRIRHVIKKCDDYLRSIGVEVVHVSVKAGRKNYGSVLAAMGYAPIDISYGRRLNHGNSSDGSSGGDGGEGCQRPDERKPERAEHA